MKTNNFAQHVKHNYDYIKNKTINGSVKLWRNDNQGMIDRLKFYQTKNGSCNCGENKLVSLLIGCDIPCKHRMCLGDKCEPCPEVELNLSNETDELEIVFNVLPDDNTTMDQEEYYKKMACKTIKRFSHYKDENEISKYIEENYNHTKIELSEDEIRTIVDDIKANRYDEDPRDVYINDVSLQLDRLIDEGIYFFSERKKTEKLTESRN